MDRINGVENIAVAAHSASSRLDVSKLRKQYIGGFQSELRTIRGANEAVRDKVFTEHARLAFQYGLRAKMDVSAVADRLQEVADEVGLIEKFGQDAVQQWISKAAEQNAKSGEKVTSGASRHRAYDHKRTNKGRCWKDKAVGARVLQAKEFAPARFILPNLIPEGVALLVGRPKIGKSWAALDWCIAVAAGRYTLGNLKPADGDVLYLALEDSERRLKRRMAKLLPEAGQWPERLTLATEWRAANEGGLDDLREWCASVKEPRMIVIDTLQKFRPAQKSGSPSYGTDYEAITGLHATARDYPGLAIICLHHNRKMEADDPFDTVSGTLGLTGAADTILLLKRSAGGAKLLVRGRDVEEGETSVQFNKSSCRWTIVDTPAGTAGGFSGERQAVLDALAHIRNVNPTGGVSVKEIMMATGRTDRNSTDQLVFNMFRDGQIVRVGRGVYALPEDANKIDKNGA